MGQNSHRSDINEDLKPWAKRVTVEQYDLAVLTTREFIKKHGKKKHDELTRG